MEEQAYEAVKDDLISNKSYGSLRIVDSSEFTTFGSCMQRATRDHAEEEIDELWIDYITRLPLDAKYLRGDHTTGMNLTIADAKRAAMSFDKGRGLAIGSPFQVNRTGFKNAKTNAGKMDKTALAQFNAAEKEADAIAYIFYDEEEAATSEPKVGMLKARYGKQTYDPVSVFMEPDSRRIIDMTAGMTAGAGYAPTRAQGSAEDEVVL